MKNLLIICFCLLILTFGQSASGEFYLNNQNSNSLSERQLFWPNWSLPALYRISDLNHDLFYPEFFNGIWQVYSMDLEDINKKPVRHLAKFELDELGRVVADRVFNAESLSKQIFGNKLIEVQNYQNSFNRQIVFFQEGKYLETKVIGRRQQSKNQNLLLTDELHLQIFHSESPPRINQVETLSQYGLCKDLGLFVDGIDPNTICGEQWQARYNFPTDTFRSIPISTNHFFLLLSPEKSLIPSDDLLVDLSNQKVQPNDYYH